MLGELLPTGGGDPIPFLKTKLLIGARCESCDISLRFPNVSSHHCELELINGYWRVRDLGSRNGTKVNGIRIESTWLLPGDQLSVAKHCYEVRYVASGESPPPEIEDVFSTSLLAKAGLERGDSKRRTDAPTEALPQFIEGLSDEDAAMRFLDEGNDRPAPQKPSRGTNEPQTDAPSSARRDSAPASARGSTPIARVRQSPPPYRESTHSEYPAPRKSESDKRAESDEVRALRWLQDDSE